MTSCTLYSKFIFHDAALAIATGKVVTALTFLSNTLAPLGPSDNTQGGMFNLSFLPTYICGKRCLNIKFPKNLGMDLYIFSPYI